MKYSRMHPWMQFFHAKQIHLQLESIERLVTQAIIQYTACLRLSLSSFTITDLFSCTGRDGSRDSRGCPESKRTSAMRRGESIMFVLASPSCESSLRVGPKTIRTCSRSRSGIGFRKPPSTSSSWRARGVCPILPSTSKDGQSFLSTSPCHINRGSTADMKRAWSETCFVITFSSERRPCLICRSDLDV